MFKKISATIQYPDWVRYLPRYRTLDILDRLLDGTFYDHLSHAFYDETKAGGTQPTLLVERRPSAQYHLPRMVSRWSARKLFAGRHVPRVRTKDGKGSKKVEKYLARHHFWNAMLEAAYYGSVGSVAATFRISESGALGVKIWRAKYCDPIFDDADELTSLRVRYLTSGGAMAAMGAADMDPTMQYWFIRDFVPGQEITYHPIKENDWDPVRGFKEKGRKLEPWPEKVFETGLDFVPGHWFKNLNGGKDPDGCCTWEDAIPNSIELDYTLSQIGRGTRYNAAPQPVIKGEILNAGEDGSVARGASTYIHLAADQKEEGGDTRSGSDAKLLEMSGSGLEASLKLIDRLRNMALEQIAASRKDPEKLKGPQSGRAMEFMDEDSDDLIMELRSSYGDGALCLVRKIVEASKRFNGLDPAQINLQWPRIFQPTPNDLSLLIPALIQAVQPLNADTQQQKPDGEGQQQVAAKAAQLREDGLITPEQARAYLQTNMDIALLDLPGSDEDEEDDEDSEPANDGVAGDAPPPSAGPAEPVEKVGPNWTIHQPINT